MGAGHSSGLPEKNLINDIFFSGKCSNNIRAINQTKAFFDWCTTLPLNEYYNATCENIGESNTTAACSYGVILISKSDLKITKVCDIGKWIIEPRDYKLEEGLYERIQESCEWWFLGKPLPWWLLLMIILIIVIAIAILAALLWTYWIKKRWNATRQTGSTLTSRWTSSPVSDAASSMVTSSPKAPSIRASSSARNPSMGSFAKTKRSRSLSSGGHSRQ